MVEGHRHTVRLSSSPLSPSSMTWTGDQRRASSRHDSTIVFPHSSCCLHLSRVEFWSSPNLGGRSWSGRVELRQWFLPFEKMGRRTFDGSTICAGREAPVQKYPAGRGPAN